MKIHKFSRICFYFTVFDVGIRFWFRPKMWLKPHIYKAGGKTIYDLGPVTIYTGW